MEKNNNSVNLQRYDQKNVERMLFVLSITDEEMAQGYDNYKVRKMLRLLSIASGKIWYWYKIFLNFLEN